MKPYLITFALLVAFATAFACLNENRVLLNGQHRVFDDASPVPYGRDLKADSIYYSRELVELDSLWKADKKIEDYSDYGVALVYLGRYEEARKVFLTIEKLQPGLYATAANLGTTYELLGDYKLALQWIKKAVEIDPTSHDNSEWLHVKILETMIKGDKFINTDFLLSTNFGNDSIPRSKLDSASLVKLRNAIYYQLNERVSFVKPKDKIVALLLFELGNICALTDDVTSALRIYDTAKDYGYKSDVLNGRYSKFLAMQAGLKNEYSKSKAIDSTKKNGSRSNNILLFNGALVMALVIVLLIRRRKARK
jgi:tetratricopeptide (TPR) repeat protein